jgi:hypothetical protein
MNPVEVKDFSFSLCVQTSYEANAASYPMQNRSPPGGNVIIPYRNLLLFLNVLPTLRPISIYTIAT